MSAPATILLEKYGHMVTVDYTEANEDFHNFAKLLEDKGALGAFYDYLKERGVLTTQNTTMVKVTTHRANYDNTNTNRY